MSPPTMSTKRMSRAGLRLVERMEIPPWLERSKAVPAGGLLLISSSMSLEIRDERATDIGGVRAVVESAFGCADEAELVERLRDDTLKIASLVAVEDGRVVGHAMFSRVWIEGAEPSVVASLAPMAVAPDRQ